MKDLQRKKATFSPQAVGRGPSVKRLLKVQEDGREDINYCHPGRCQKEKEGVPDNLHHVTVRKVK